MKTTFDHLGYSVEITVHLDNDHGAPWEENDGHGVVSDWTRRDKHPGEMVLCSDRFSRRYYDFAASMQIAKRDGWGLSVENVLKLEKELGRRPADGEIRAAAVMHDYQYLHGWANDQWHYVGYTTEITTPDGAKIDGDSCWGFDDEDYMIAEATDQAKHTIAAHIALCEQTEIAACVP